MSLTLTNCQVNKSDTENYIEKFKENRIEFENLVKKIKGNKLLIPKYVGRIKESELDTESRNEIKNLEIGEIYLSDTECEGKMNVEFSTNWTTKASVYFNQNECDCVQSKIGYHSKTTMIEVWGLGNGWIMWIDYDFI